MGITKIEWCDFVFNAWTGCTKVSPACDHCYAESWAKRSGIVEWGNHPRRRTSEAYWLQPLKWNRRAEQEGVRRKVFCCSLADVFDNQAPAAWREDLWRLIWATPALDWLLLTKRPQNIAKMVPNHIERPWPYPNVWLGTTVENQDEAVRRIPHLLNAPAKVHFLSCEPLLGRIHLPRQDTYWNPIDWVISGGESGPNARPWHPDWARSLREQCADMNIPFFWKQNGEYSQEDSTRRAEPMALANDGTLYRSRDIAWPDGVRYGEAIRANHDKAHLTMVYRTGKKRAGALLDGQAWRQFPPTTGALDF